MVFDLVKGLFDGNVEEIAPDEVVDGDYVVLDVRGKDAYQAGHIPGALHLPYSNLEEKWDEVLADIDYEDEIAVICVRGISSKSVAGKLMEAGYKNVKSVQGGMNAWNGEVEHA